MGDFIAYRLFKKESLGEKNQISLQPGEMERAQQSTSFPESFVTRALRDAGRATTSRQETNERVLSFLQWASGASLLSVVCNKVLKKGEGECPKQRESF